MSLDHKTFKQRRDKSSLSNQFSGHCCLLKSRQVLVNKIGLQTSLKIEECLTREPVSYSADRLIEWQSEILPYWAYKYIEYQDTEYCPPNYTSCDSMYGPCMFKEVCESDRGMRNETLSMNFIKAPSWDPRNRATQMNIERYQVRNEEIERALRTIATLIDEEVPMNRSGEYYVHSRE